MSIEIPTDVIREVQKQIREQSGLGSYDPNDASLPSLPAVEDVISELDPSPASLRCKRCKGSFLNGAQSLFCVYCGAERHDPEAPPEPIKFNSTSAYRWLLDALKLDGSEIVRQGTEEDEPKRGQASSKKELTVAELLDLEIRWPERPKKVVEMDTGNQFSPNKSLRNSPGVDVENFFPSSISGAGAVSTLEKPDSTVHNESIETSAAQGHGDVDLFENVVSMEADGQHNSDETGNDSSNWATQFQGVTSVNPQNESPSFDSFGVSPSYLSAQFDSVFGSEKDLKVEKLILAPEDPSPSNKYSNEDDLWTNFSSGVSEQLDKLEARTVGVQDVSRNLDSYEDEDWVLGDQLQTGSGKVSDSVKVDDDSYDAWNDFSTSSSKLQHQFNGSSEPMPSGSHASEINLFNSNDLQDNDFGDFSQPALFSSSLQTSSMGLNHLQSESNVSDRMHDDNTKTEELDGESKSMNDMDTLMSQMHDLSFMLESNLSIPQHHV